jgi:hypothetical protein
MRRPRLAVATGVAALTLLISACAASTTAPGAIVGGTSPSTAVSSGQASNPSAGAQTPATVAASTSAGDWPTYHRTNDRAGQVIGAPAPHGLAQAWTARLDGAVYGQPLVLGDLVIVATEGDTVYGLSLAGGQVRWRRPLGTPVPRRDLPCGNIDPLGITGTPAYDARSGSVFVVSETTGARHDLVAIDPATGAVRFTRNLDVTVRDRYAEQQRGALAVAGGRVYVPFGGLAGDCGNYIGYVTATAVDGSTTTRYEVPSAREAGMWAPSGVAVDGAGGVWVAVGNGASLNAPYDGSDSVLRLSADLGRRLDFFAPRNWGAENAQDADLGSTGPLLLDAGRALIAGKTGDVYLLDTTHLGGIGGQVTSIPGCHAFGGMAWDAASQAAFLPCTEGVQRVDVQGRSLTAGWRASVAVTGSPVLGGGAVWALDVTGGDLHVLAAATGRQITTRHVGAVSRFASPVLSGRTVLVGTMTGVQALSVS